MATKKKTTGSGRRKSTVKSVAMTTAAAAGGAVVGAALGRLGLLGGIGLIIAGTVQNNPLLTVAGACAAVAPGALGASEKSDAGGIKGHLQDAQASIKKLAANVLPKTGINIVLPNAFPALQLAGIDGVSYYGGASEDEVDTRFQNALMSGTYDDDDDSVGRLLETSVQAAEVAGEMAGFDDVAKAASGTW